MKPLEQQKLYQLGKKLVTCGFRGIALICGDRQFQNAALAYWYQLFPGDWLWVGDVDCGHPMVRIPPTAAREILGQQKFAAVFDAYEGLNAEALAAVSGTLCAGGWLLILLPKKTDWFLRPDKDSLRWADSAKAIPTPNFMHYFSRCLQQVPITEWEQGDAPKFANLGGYPSWQGGVEKEQQELLRHLLSASPGVHVLIAPRGRGKSALAGQLAKLNGKCLVTAPAKRATEVLAHYAQENFHYRAPDDLLAELPGQSFEWLIIDEAAAIPAPLLLELVRLYPHTLLTTTVQGYEGTGRGFILKFCQRIQPVQLLTLHEPLRFAEGCPLETFINKLFLFSTLNSPSQAQFLPLASSQISTLEVGDWQQMTTRACQFYQLLESAHYRTSPLDLRRMMDGHEMQFWLVENSTSVIAAGWLLQEGGLTPELSQAIWAGIRRPRGNLVAQSLAAHSGFPEAAQLNSLRISRIAVLERYRRLKVGQRLVRHIITNADKHDYISVSFGFTEELWKFWQHCGFTLVRLGSQIEASSGCHAAMAIYPLSSAGIELTAAASRRWQRDWQWLQPVWFSSLSAQLFPTTYPQIVESDDWLEVVGFAFASRALSVSFPALARIWQHYAKPDYPNLSALFTAVKPIVVNGKKHWLQQLRQELRRLLLQLSDDLPELAQLITDRHWPLNLDESK